MDPGWCRGRGSTPPWRGCRWVCSPRTRRTARCQCRARCCTCGRTARRFRWRCPPTPGARVVPGRRWSCSASTAQMAWGVGRRGRVREANTGGGGAVSPSHGCVALCRCWLAAAHQKPGECVLKPGGHCSAPAAAPMAAVPSTAATGSSSSRASADRAAPMLACGSPGPARSLPVRNASLFTALFGLMP
jgi:hypothetical protein